MDDEGTHRIVHLAFVQDFRNIRVWHDARALRARIYELVATFPGHERRGLSDQLRRSARSIGANIAEGFGESSRWDCARCVQISIGEAGETLSHLYDALDLHYISQEQFDAVASELCVLRRRIGALYFKVRPSGNGRRREPVRRRRRRQSGRDSDG